MKKLFKDKENRNFILILLGITIVVALIGWIKSGGDFETAGAIFFAFFVLIQTMQKMQTVCIIQIIQKIQKMQTVCIIRLIQKMQKMQTV